MIAVSYTHLIRQAGPCVFIGVGSQQYNQKINAYTRSAYQYLFNKDYLHSVRDSYTEQALKSIGIHNVVNTACPTMWSLTEEKCASIPTSKASTVVLPVSYTHLDVYKRQGIPTVSTMISMDIVNESALNYGFIGAYGDRAANFIVAKSDLLLSLGARLDVRQVGAKRENFAPNATLIRVEVDEGELAYRVHDLSLIHI